ncbi:uncharacterized protein LOC126560884 [Anopheles maculipalpis]|uniref:uncharacterized protein LOC126560606 n=1 Tax=Anopheles maculipalpis TaxID=1496333 RepID=UPI002158ABBD|nr:uncharacterized protein LOC126560606 [Anopheles maculipalpis]XP_050072791.1 uncharacterized protein LOC126560884 [Anopheles maculipalpis]
MATDEKATTEASRQLTALEAAVREIFVEASSGKLDPAMASVKEAILNSLWQDGNATLLRLEALTGPNPRRGTFTEAYAKAKCALGKLRQSEGSTVPSLDVTLATLEERFYKKRVAFLGHFRQLLDIPKMATASANGLMRIIDVVETSIASAKQIAGTTDQRATSVEDGLLVSIVLGKLDEGTTERITRRLDAQSIPTWKELRGELDRLSNQLYYEPKKKEVVRAHPNSAPARPARTALSATVQPVLAKQDYTGTRRCYACDKTGHVGTLCPELRVRSACQRVNFVMDQRKCVNCLSKQHPASKCPSEKRCQVCSKKHHTLLHAADDVYIK